MIIGTGELIQMERGTGKTSQMVAEVLAEQEALNRAGDTQHKIVVSVLSEQEMWRVGELLDKAGVPLTNTRLVSHKRLSEMLRGVGEVSVYIDEFTEIPRSCHEVLDIGVANAKIGVRGWYS